MNRAGALGRLARLVAAGDPRERLIARMCEAGRVLAGGRGGSISINNDDTSVRMTMVATDELAAELESLQEILGEGPGRDAYRRNEAVVTDLRDLSGDRWPEFVRSARESAGDLTLHCFPMRPVGHPIGVFTLYADSALTESADIVQFLSDSIGVAVLQESPGPDLDGVWAARSIVHQATGMVVAQLRLPPDDALAILRAHAFAQGTTVDEIADQIVHRRLDFRTDDT